MWTSARAGVAQHLHDLARRVAAHDRVVDHDQPLARHDLRQRVELQPQAVLAQLLAGLDERARDVAVLDQAVVLREPAGARVAARGGVARVGHRDHEVGVDRRLAREDLAHPPARDLQHLAARAASPGARSRCARTRRARGAALCTAWRVCEPARASSETTSPGWTSRRKLGADDVERAGLARRRSSASPSRPSDSGRSPSGSRNATTRSLVMTTVEKAPSRRGITSATRVLERVRLVGGEQRGDDLGVRGGAERDAALAQLGVQLDRVDRGCRCGRARARAGRRARPAASSPTRTSRWSSSGRGRPPCRPAARAASARRRPG